MSRSVFAALLALAAASPALAQEYRLPLELGGPIRAPYVTAYRDHSGAGNGLRDWNCGNNTYDGHRGTDIGIGGFAAMDAGSRWVVAVAPGTVTAAVDGCFDRCTSGSCNCGAGFGNSVRVRHADGTSTWYGHLKNGTVQVRNGATVTCGQRLGKVGSSGNSTGPHLHFEPRYSNNTSDDPFGGRCGGPEIFWVQQNAYNALPADRCANAPPPPPPPPPPPARGTLKGVVFDRGATAGPNDAGNVRVVGAVVQVTGGPRATARARDGFFELELAPGTYTYRASADGFDPATRTVEIRAGADTWGSIGIARTPVAKPPAEPPMEPVEPTEPVEPVTPAEPEEPAILDPEPETPPTGEEISQEPPAAAEDVAGGIEGGGCAVVPVDAWASLVIVLCALGAARRRLT